MQVFYCKIIHNLIGENHIDASIVRPKYDSIGKSFISSKAIHQIIEHCVKKYNDLIKIRKIKIKKRSKNYDFEILLNYPYCCGISESTNKLRETIRENIELSTGIIVGKINIIISKIYSSSFKILR